jgi:hypothetical protein
MMRKPPSYEGTRHALCQYYQLPALAGRHPGTSCGVAGVKRVDDVIPSLLLCASHYSEYQKSCRGTIVKEDRLR